MMPDPQGQISLTHHQQEGFFIILILEWQIVLNIEFMVPVYQITIENTWANMAHSPVARSFEVLREAILCYICVTLDWSQVP